VGEERKRKWMKKRMKTMKNKLLLLFVSLLLLVGGVSAVILPPVTPPPIPVSGEVSFFFWNDSSDFGTSYNKFSTYPQLQDTVFFSQTVTQASGPKTIGRFVTESFPNGKILAPGLTRYRVYLNTSSDVGVTTFDFIPYNVSSSGVETRMFFGVPRSVDINTQTPTEYLISYARRNYTYFLPGERLLIKVNLSTTSVVSRTGYIGIAGTSYASMAQIGYWLPNTSSSITTNYNESYAYSPSKATPLSGWIVVVLTALALFACAFLFRLRNEDGEISKERIIFSIVASVVCGIAAYLSLEVIIPSGGLATSVVYQLPVISILFVILSIIAFANFIYCIMQKDMVQPEKKDYKNDQEERT
jgi:hypothetical protein